MMFDEELQVILNNFNDIYKSFKTKKIADKKKNKKQAEMEIQKQIRQFSKKKKFPYLITLNITNTKVTQYSLLQILKLTPFNMSFRIEHLFEQYSTSNYTKLDDHVINELSTSPYLQNFKILNLENITCTSNTLGKLMRSQKAININSMILNTTNLSEDAFITLANSTNLPQLEYIKCVEDKNPAIRKSYHYIMRAQYLSMNLKTDEIMKKQDVMDTSQFIQSVMNSFYMNNIQSLEIHGAHQFMQQIKSLFKLSLFTQHITKVGLYDINDNIEYKDVWQMIAASKSFPRLTYLNVKSLSVKDHLIILLNQKFKPSFDMESLLKDNKKLIDDEVIIFISKMPLLLNSKEIDLSDLSKVSKNAWKEFANSKYVVNLKTISFSEGTLLNYKTDSEEAVKRYFFSSDPELAGDGKCCGLFSQNNFFNLEKLDINNNKGLPIYELRYILESIKKRHVSVKFNFEDIFIQIIDQIRPILLIQSSNNNNEQQNDDYPYKGNLQDFLWNEYVPGLHKLFETYFLKDREWYNIRHKTLDLTYYQFMRHFGSFQDIFRQIQDLSCIETIKFFEGGFDSVFSTLDMKFLNLKNVKILNLFDKSLVADENGYQIKNILKQKYIKPYIFNINGFLDNYNMNSKIQSQLLEKDVYIECQHEFKIYLHFIDSAQIQKIFDKGDVHFAAQTITLLDESRIQQHHNLVTETEEDQEENKENSEEVKLLMEKQELFIQLLANSKNFSQIKKIETPLALSLKSVKQLLNSKVLARNYDIQKHVLELEVDEEYFELLVKSRYYRNIHRLVIPKFIKPTQKQVQIEPQNSKQGQQSKIQNTKPVAAKIQINPQKLEIDKIQKLQQIQVLEQIEDSDFLTKLFSIDNVRFNRDLVAEKFSFNKLNSDQFKNVFSQEKPGKDWDILLNLLEKNKDSIDGQVYEQLIMNKSACFFFTQLIIPDKMSEIRAGELISSINKAMKTNQHMKQLLVTKLEIKQFPSPAQIEGTEEEKNDDQPSEIKVFLSLLNNVKEINFSNKVKFGLNEAQILIKHTTSTALSEIIMSKIIPKLNKQELNMLWTFLSNDKEIPMNLSFMSFQNNKHFYSQYALDQKINELRSNKKSKKVKEKEDEDSEEEGQEEKEGNEEKEEKEEKQKEQDDDAGVQAGEEEDDDEDELDEENQDQNNKDENQDQDQDNKAIQKQIEDLKKTAITEEDLFEFLSHFKGLREIDFSGTNIDIYHLKKLKTLPHASIMHFINFKDCLAFNDCIPFIWFISEQTKPWYQLQKYLQHLPLKTCKNHKQLLKVLFLSKFFKKNLRFLDVDFIMRDISESNKDLVDLFSYILKRRISNLDITSFLQGLPIYMKNFINDSHIEQVCKIYGNLLYLQPEIFPSVQYGFNHILQQKNIPTAIRLMYLLNQTFQKKVSASSLSTIYQVALQSEDLKEKQFISESDEQIEKLLIKLQKRIQIRRKLLQRRKDRNNKAQEKEQDSKNLKILNIIGTKKIVKNKKDIPIVTETKNGTPLLQAQNDEKNNNNDDEDDIDNIVQNAKQQDDEEDNKQLDEEQKEEEEEKDQLDKEEIEEEAAEAEEGNQLGEDGDDAEEGEEGEGGDDQDLGLENQGDEENIDNQQEKDKNNDDFILNDESMKDSPSSRRDSVNDSQMDNFRGSTSYHATKTSRFGQNKKQPKIKYNFENKIQSNKQQVKNNLNRVYNTQVALKLHKQLVNLHILSETLKNQSLKNNNLDKKIKEADKQIDFIEFELQILKYHRNNFFAQEVNNLFNFFEVLNLGENNHLNIYGLNYYVAEHILPWIKMNQNLNELKEGQKRAQKILNFLNNKEENEDEFEMANVLSPDHALDDKLIEQLSYLIDKRLKQLRQIDLCGLNVSDDFAEKFSLILSSDKNLEHLTLLDLTNNRRLSPFGLKFLFSSIVNRIPQGFKVLLSATANDAEQLRIQIELLEKSILREAVYIIEKQKKEVEKYIRNNKKKLNNPPKQIQKKPSLEEYDFENGKNMPNMQLEFGDPNMPAFSDVYDDDQPKPLSKMEDELNLNDYDSVDSEEERRKKLQAGELQFFFQKEKSLDVRIVKKLEKDESFKKKIENLRTFQLAYRKALSESGYKTIQTSSSDIRLVVQNIVNLGLYSAINIIVRDNWKRKRATIIIVGILIAPLTFFHLMMVATYSITRFLQKNQIELRCKFGSQSAIQTKIELDKLVPENIQNTDFFFDEDVAQVDILLSSNQSKKMPTDIQRRNGRLICEYLNNPNTVDFKDTYKKINQNKNKEINVLRYIDYIIIFNFFIYTLFICCAYTYYIIFHYLPTYLPEQSCKNIPVLFDVPFYITGLIIIAYEAALLQNIEKVIVSKKIFNFKSLFVLFQLYNSFIQRYNLYTDMIFAFNIYYCDKAPDLGIISLSILGIHLLFQSIQMITEFVNVQIIKSRIGKKPQHNTEFINIYTKIALIQDFSGLSSVLDRFSTSSTITLQGWYIPRQLSNIKVPQILLTKFQKVFLEDIPQTVIVLIYNLRFAKSTNLLEWENLRVLLTTVLSMYNSLNSAWQAHPSVFRTYQMQQYMKFRQDINEIYKIKITEGDEKNFHSLSIPRVISKTLSFNQKYTIKKETPEDRERIKRREQQKKKKKEADAQSQKGPQSLAASSAALSDNKSVVASEKSIPQSQQSIKSRVSVTGTTQQSVKSDKNLKQLAPSEFKQKLIEFLLEKEKQNAIGQVDN